MLNLEIFRALNNLAGRSDVLDTLVIFCAVYLGWWAIVGACFLIYQRRRTIFSKDAFLFLPAVVSYILAEVIKYLYPSPRPFEALENVRVLFTHGGGDSFPSGHAAFFFALALSVWFYNRKWGVVFFVAATLISLSRVISGIHWPVDILAGAVLGVAISLVFKPVVAGHKEIR